MVSLSIMGMPGGVNSFCLAARRSGPLSVARRRSADAFVKDADRPALPLVQPFARVDMPPPRPWDPSTLTVLALLGLMLWLRPGVLLAQTTPRVQITLPTTAATWTTTATPLTVAGTARDNKGVVGVTWAIEGDGNGPAQGTTGWTAQVPLQPGTNRLTVTAVDADGNKGQAVLTVTLTSVPPPPRTITLAWDDTNTSGDGFQMQRCVGPLPCTFATVATIAFTDRSWTDTTVLSGQAYCYRVAVTLGTLVGPYSNTTCSP